jgi:Raf kinase inhibitor-like YbhB/YbcL family protein
MLEKLPDAVGHTLRKQRAGLEKIAFNSVSGLPAIEVSSPAFVDHEPLPAKYTADGEGLSPPLQWGSVPPATDMLVWIVEDADAPTPHPLVHAIVVELPPEPGSLPEGALSTADDKTLQLGRNSYMRASWMPPDPPPGHGPHRYVFQLFALSPGPPFFGAPGRSEVLEAIRERAIASGCLIGTYERPEHKDSTHL